LKCDDRKVEVGPTEQPATRWELEGTAVEIPLNRTPGQKFRKHQCSPRSPWLVFMEEIPYFGNLTARKISLYP
jgi:hypothetical protein